MAVESTSTGERRYVDLDGAHQALLRYLYNQTRQA